jgi:hypothetical protein
VIQEKPHGIFTIVITESGVELLRETISGTGSGAWDWAQGRTCVVTWAFRVAPNQQLHG